MAMVLAGMDVLPSIVSSSINVAFAAISAVVMIWFFPTMAPMPRRERVGFFSHGWAILYSWLVEEIFSRGRLSAA